MALRTFKQYTQFSAKQRTSQLNGTIPGRMAKPYHVSFLDAHEQPKSVVHVDHIGTGSFTAVQSVRGLDLDWVAESATFTYDPFDFPAPGPVVDAAMAAALRSLNKARDNAFNAAVAVAELPSAINMFASTAKRVTSALAALRKGDLRRAYKALGKDYRGRPPRADKVQDRASSYWLELQYGWLPLLSDVYSAAHKAASIQVAPRLSVKGTASGNDVALSITPSGGSRVVRRKLEVQCGFSYSVENGFIAHAASMGFTNPMLIAWETVPLSFVVDWLIPIGGWLQGFSAYHGLAFVDGCTSRRGHRIESVSYGGNSATTYASRESSPGVYYLVPSTTTTHSASSIYSRSSGFRRDVIVEFPSVRFPSVGLDASWRKLATSIALLVQRRK